MRHRTVDFEPVVVPFEGRFYGVSGGEGVRHRIELVVAQELEQGAVIGVAARLRHDVNLGGLMAELGGVDAGLHLELLDRVDGREHHVGREVRIGVADAVSCGRARGRRARLFACTMATRGRRASTARASSC